MCTSLLCSRPTILSCYWLTTWKMQMFCTWTHRILKLDKFSDELWFKFFKTQSNKHHFLTFFSFIIHFTLFSVHWLKVFINSVVKRKEFKNRKGMRDVFTYVCLSLVVGDFFVLIFWICFCFYKWRPSRDLSTKPESP